MFKLFISTVKTFISFGLFSCLLNCLFMSLSSTAASVDPTRPFGKSSASIEINSGQKLVLESIIHGDGIHTVVINGKVLKVGEMIGEYLLVAVNDDNVVLTTTTERLNLFILNSKVFKEQVVNSVVVK